MFAGEISQLFDTTMLKVNSYKAQQVSCVPHARSKATIGFLFCAVLRCFYFPPQKSENGQYLCKYSSASFFCLDFFLFIYWAFNAFWIVYDMTWFLRQHLDFWDWDYLSAQSNRTNATNLRYWKSWVEWNRCSNFCTLILARSISWLGGRRPLTWYNQPLQRAHINS